MRTFIITAHEEQYSDGSKTLGVLLNNEVDGNKVDSLIYIYRKGMYIFFNTIMEMNDYLLYASYSKVKRAYMSEEDFDYIYDTDSFQGLFSSSLVWTTKG